MSAALSRPFVDQTPLDFKGDVVDVWHRVSDDCARVHQVPVSAVRGTSRLRTSTLARHHAWFVLRDTHQFSWVEIGRAVGCDHTSVMAGAKHFARVCGLIGWRG